MNKNKIITSFIWLIGILEVCLMGYTFYYNYGSMDHAEHLHASWLVWQGQIPYKDFFEHHNPLLWYILSPIVALFYNNALILYVSKIIAFISNVLLFHVLYKITKRFMGYSFNAFLLSLIVYFSLPDSYYTLYELHPDELMLCFYFWGFYYYCLHLETLKQKYLNLSFIMFVISFLFLQKIMIILFFMGLCTLYFIYKKKINIKSILIALIIPILILSIFVIWLYVNDVLDIYYLFNYNLNLYMQKFYKLSPVYGDFWCVSYLSLISLFMLKDFLKDKNIYKIVFVLIIAGEYFSKYILGAPHHHYFVLNNLTSALIIGYYLNNNIDTKKVKTLVCFMLLISIYLFNKTPINKLYPRYYKMHEYIFSLTSKDDYILSAINYINIYGKDASYYWFGYGNIAPVAYYLYQYKEPFLLNTSIIKHKPKVIYNNLYANQLTITNFVNKVKFDEYISNLYDIYDEFPEKIETKEDFVKRWSLKEFLKYDINLIRLNYIPHPYFPIFIRRDLILK